MFLTLRSLLNSPLVFVPICPQFFFATAIVTRYINYCNHLLAQFLIVVINSQLFLHSLHLSFSLFLPMLITWSFHSYIETTIRKRAIKSADCLYLYRVMQSPLLHFFFHFHSVHCFSSPNLSQREKGTQTLPRYLLKISLIFHFIDEFDDCTLNFSQHGQ